MDGPEKAVGPPRLSWGGWHGWRGRKALPGTSPPALHAGRGVPGRLGAHLEDGDPGVADVVEADGPVVRVGVARAAHVVVLVPVDAGVVTRATCALGLRLPVGLPAQPSVHSTRSSRRLGMCEHFCMPLSRREEQMNGFSSPSSGW